MAVKIKLKRLGKIRAPYYRIVVADARTKRDGRAIEEIGKYHPKDEPSFIEVNSERVQHWLSVGAQPTDPVRKILEVTGDWQRFKGLPGAEGTLKTAAPRSDKKEAFAAALAETLAESGAAEKPKGKAAGKGAEKAEKGGKPARAKSGKAESGKAESGKAESGKAESGKAESGKAESGKAETAKPEGAQQAKTRAKASAASKAEAAASKPGKTSDSSDAGSGD